MRYSVETEPLGTGGAIKLAMEHVDTTTVFVLNGDTYLELDYGAMLAAHDQANATLTVAVHDVPDASRYGALDIEDGRIRGFFEKGRPGPGSINAGVYLLSRDLLNRYSLSRAFSFETDFLMPHVREINPLAFRTQGHLHRHRRAGGLHPRSEDSRSLQSKAYRSGALIPTCHGA